MSQATSRHATTQWTALFLLAIAAAMPPAAPGAEENASPVNKPPAGEATDVKADSAEFFTGSIAPLLSRHCLECHDAASAEGGLDLSRKAPAFSGGDNGEAIVPGKAEASLIWELVSEDAMPLERPPLTDAEKQLLRDWIDAGANWAGDAIDPNAHKQRGRRAYNGVRRLTVEEYIETVYRTVGVDVQQEAREILPRDLRADGFSNTAYNLNIDLGHVQGYAELAEIIVGRMDLPAFAAKYTSSTELSDENLRELLAAMGKWILRGPLEEREVQIYMTIAAAVAEDGGDFEETVSCMVEAMLQSPRFIYRIEKQQGDGQPQRVSDYELAVRLSYILWGGPPDEELMRAADAGELSERSQVAAQVERMLDDPRAIETSARFIRELLNLDRLANLRPNAERFPAWSEELASDMREETLAFFHDVVWEQQRPLSDLLNAQVTYLTPRLAAHYGLEPAEGGNGRGVGLGAPLASVPQRVSEGLLALYTFGEGSGSTVHDSAETGDPMHLTISNPEEVRWSDLGLSVGRGENQPHSTVIATASPPLRLTEALKQSHAVTIEAWITPANASQSGPARIVTLSRDPSSRNFTLGQDADNFDVRFRTTKTDAQGQPSLSSPSGTAHPQPTHVVYTRDAEGQATLYVDGIRRGSRDTGGDLASWSESFLLALGNEASTDRPWQGTFHLAALYDRALSAAEVGRNWAVGARRDGPPELAGKNDLQALYEFNQGRGDEVRNASDAGHALRLRIEDPAAVQWSEGGLRIDSPTRLATVDPPTNLIEAIRASQSLTLEAWITPADAQQTGPARILTLSSGPNERNFTLGQEDERFEVRLRTSETSANGLPGLTSNGGAVTTLPTHIVYTRDLAGDARLYVNGEEHSRDQIRGDLSNWDGGFRLALGNEATMDRPWRGTFHSVAIYSRALTPDEVRSKGATLSRYDLASVPSRGGLLTQGSVLTIGGDEASMVARGLFVLHDLLYSEVGDPPPCVDTTPVPTEPGLSQRAIAEARLADASCAGCHVRFEPLAFGLEKFDGLGTYHDIDPHGNELRDDGAILVPGESQAVPYESSAELMDLLAGSERVKMNMTRKVTQFALGRPLVSSDEPVLADIHAAAQEAGGTYASLITAIVMSDLVQRTQTETLP